MSPAAKDSGIRRLQPLIHLDPLLIVLNTDRLQPDSLDIWGTADADKNLVDRHIVLLDHVIRL